MNTCKYVCLNCDSDYCSSSTPCSTTNNECQIMLWWKRISRKKMTCLIAYFLEEHTNVWWPSDAIWKHRSGHWLGVFELAYSSYYLNKCWLITFGLLPITRGQFYRIYSRCLFFILVQKLPLQDLQPRLSGANEFTVHLVAWWQHWNQDRSSATMT